MKKNKLADRLKIIKETYCDIKEIEIEYLLKQYDVSTQEYQDYLNNNSNIKINDTVYNNAEEEKVKRLLLLKKKFFNNVRSTPLILYYEMMIMEGTVEKRQQSLVSLDNSINERLTEFSKDMNVNKKDLIDILLRQGMKLPKLEEKLKIEYMDRVKINCECVTEECKKRLDNFQDIYPEKKLYEIHNLLIHNALLYLGY